MSDSTFVKEVGAAEFAQEVLTRSAERPVVVDFWAPWCAPCRMLTPVLEAEVNAMGGAVELAKVNTDQHPALAAEYGVQGIPAVKAFQGGRIVAEFSGARGAPFVKGWLEGLVPSPSALRLAEADEALRTGRPGDAETLLRSLLADDRARNRASLLLARAQLALGRTDEVRTLLDAIDPRSEEAEAVPALERLLGFAEDAGAFGGEQAARAAVEGDGKNLEARWALASALAARAEYAEALEQLLEIVSRSRKFREDGARQAMLAIFDQLGPEHELSGQFRRRLQIVL